jgi:hypothetical protein
MAPKSWGQFDIQIAIHLPYDVTRLDVGSLGQFWRVGFSASALILLSTNIELSTETYVTRVLYMLGPESKLLEATFAASIPSCMLIASLIVSLIVFAGKCNVDVLVGHYSGLRLFIRQTVYTRFHFTVIAQINHLHTIPRDSLNP